LRLTVYRLKPPAVSQILWVGLFYYESLNSKQILIQIFHRFDPSKHYSSLKIASLRDRVIAQLIDAIILSAICSVIIFLFSGGKIYSLWVAPIIPQFLLEISKDYQSNPANFWWGGHFYSIHLPYGKDIFLNYPAPLLWLVYGLYYSLFIIFKNQTPGKMMKRLVVLTSDGTSPTITQSFFRWMAYYLSFIPLGLGFWWSGFSSDHKTWHDRICKTQVYYFE
jgi:uncharacterized RDD family membrane protein YckC